MKRLDSNDVFALTGLGLLGIGLLLVFPPAAFIVVGALLIAYALLPDAKSVTR